MKVDEQFPILEKFKSSRKMSPVILTQSSFPAQQCCNLYLPQSLIVAFSGPHLRQRDRHKDTQGGKQTAKKDRKGWREEDKERKIEKQ